MQDFNFYLNVQLIHIKSIQRVYRSFWTFLKAKWVLNQSFHLSPQSQLTLFFMHKLSRLLLLLLLWTFWVTGSQEYIIWYLTWVSQHFWSLTFTYMRWPLSELKNVFKLRSKTTNKLFSNQWRRITETRTDNLDVFLMTHHHPPPPPQKYNV